ncbi:MAG: hypothetical protein P0Y55_02805 [Candidatus Cohnella colombiensis]|uniref:Uncharacterized protein n=1 Tax=Candidatus Cohnella colombiensis TaxID=3121368 RepID=A0AA95JAZ5_9BACL|nr:MAG: hypothetical protein P0Y55_02805 [Cohnella sp.]
MAKRLHVLATDATQQKETVQPKDSQTDNGTSSVKPEDAQTLYTFDGSAFELYVEESHPQPDGSVYNVYAIRNARTLTLPAYSAIYVTAGYSYIAFKDDHYNYNYGGYIVIANHTDKPKTIQAGEINYSVSYFYRDNMGTTTNPDGTSHKITATGPYVRLIAYQGDFDESKEYMDYLTANKDLYRGDWMTVKPRSVK